MTRLPARGQVTAGRAAGALLGALLALGGLPGAASPGPKPPVRLLVPQCGAALPLDAGQAFAGPRFLVWEDRVALFEPAPPAESQQVRPPWRLRSRERLPAAPPATGLDRARVKWRDGALWMKAGTRVYQRDAASGQWFLMADPGLDFRDFEVDLKGRVLLVATADPARRTYRALLEEVGADRKATTIRQEYPERDDRDAFRRLPPMVAATLVSGYESIQVDEFFVLYNPLARRVFIHRDLDGGFREAELGLHARSVADLAPTPGAPAESPNDLCWQVLPKDRNEAWIVLPARALPRTGDSAADPAADTAKASAGRDEPPSLVAIPLDLLEGHGGTPVPLPGCRLPVYPDPKGRLVNLAEALKAYQAPTNPSRHPATGP